MAQQLPWQIRISSLFDTMTPDQVQRRDPYWREDDLGFYSPDTNVGVRVRSYVSDGHHDRQELALFAGTNAGQVFVGGDNSGDPSAAITYADVILAAGGTFNVQVPTDSFLWNSTPFNDQLNTYFNMPFEVQTADEAFNLAAGVAGVSGLQKIADKLSKKQPSAVTDTAQSITGITQALGVDGGVKPSDLLTPFGIWSVLTPQKIPMLNFAAIAVLELLMTGKLNVLYTTVPPVPIVPTPILTALLPIIKEDWETAYLDSVQGTVLGSQLRDLMLSSVPGMDLAAGI
jgi:hypothetical protein